MDAIRDYLNKPVGAGVVGFIAGAVVGLVVLGWWLFPVSYTDAFPEHSLNTARFPDGTSGQAAYGERNRPTGRHDWAPIHI